jgi:hypothetical protein
LISAPAGRRAQAKELAVLALLYLLQTVNAEMLRRAAGRLDRQLTGTASGRIVADWALIQADHVHPVAMLVCGVWLAALALAFWPHSDLALRRSLVFSLLLLTSGSLVWLNGDRSSRLSAAGAALGVGLWLALLTIPGLMPLLSLAPLQTPQVLTVVAGAVITTLLAALVTRRPA